MTHNNLSKKGLKPLQKIQPLKTPGVSERLFSCSRAFLFFESSVFQYETKKHYSQKQYKNACFNKKTVQPRHKNYLKTTDLKSLYSYLFDFFNGSC